MKRARNVTRKFESLENRQLLAADPVISEFVARNESSLEDRDGESQDWIEIFNRGDESIDLEDWHLTDDPGDLNKWRFPSRRVDPGEAIVVFASAKDWQGEELHANFRLSGDGEYLALVKPDGSTVADEFAPTFPRQVTDVSYGTPMEHLVIAPSPRSTVVAITATLVSHFTFDDPADLGDDVGALNNDARAVGDARYSSSSRVGAGALLLDGDGDFLEVLNSGDDYTSLDDDGDGFTFAAWVNVDGALSGNRRLFSLDMEGGPFQANGWGVGLRDGNTLLATTYGRVDFDEPSQAALEDGDWRHVAYVYDTVAGTVEFFLDGVSLGSRSGAPAGMTESPSHSDYLIGALNLTSSGNGQFYGGLLDDVRIYDQPLSPSEVASLTVDADEVTSIARYWVPGDGRVDTVWMQDGFDDSSWAAGAAAIGYDVDDSVISEKIRQTIPVGSTSVYVRAKFEIEDASRIESLLLRMRFDDGFVAYLNGTLVAQANAPASPRFDSFATTDRDSSLATEWAAFDLSQSRPLLVNGSNTLAIHALNDAATSDEFLVVPDLMAVTSRDSFYLDVATPGAINATGNQFGPLIERVSHAPSVPTDDDDLIVTARVSELAGPIASVTLHYRAMYEAESILAMNDAGLAGDLSAGDGVYTAVIPAEAASVGQMLRYYISTTDEAGRQLREPFLPDPSNATSPPEYLGTVVADPSVTTGLPVFQWFVPDPTWHMRSPGNPSRGNNRDWTAASVFYDGEFYDNIQVRTRGSATVQNWPKPKFKFEFNDVHEFRYADDRERVDEFNLQSHYIEVLPGAGLGSTAVSYMRETLAFEFLQEIGASASTAFHMRVQQNGEFYALASFIEQVDRTFLRRNGFDDDGAMYKATPTVQSTLAPNPNPGVYRKVTRREEPFDDLRQLTDGLNGRLDGISIEQFIFDNINLPQVINLMAGQTILMNHDRLTKNYYVHRDVETGEWSRFPWDVEQAFSNPQWEHFVSVLYGDSEHTQGTGNERQYPNYLLDAILDTPTTRQMYLERLRTLMDQYLGDGPGYFENRIDELALLIAPDARLDQQRWRAGVIENGIASIKANLQTRREVLDRDPLVPPRDAVLHSMELLSENADVSVLIPTGPEDGIVNGESWHVTDATFPDTPKNGWTQGTTGVGYDRRPDYEPYLQFDVSDLIDPDGDGTNVSNSVYARLEFDVTDPTKFDRLALHIRYDDGFVAYLNGHEIARDRAPDPITWDSRATRTRESGSAFDEFEFATTLPDGLTPVLVQGTNVLAIHALNRSTSDSDFLVQPKIVGGILEPRRVELRFGDVDTDGIEQDNEIVYNPISGNQDEEYVSIINAGNTAVDMTGWRIEGGVEVAFQPGTVLPANSTLYVSPNVSAFRARSMGPSGLQSLFVRTNDRGHLSNFGETLTLLNELDETVAVVTTPSAPSDVQRHLRISEIHYNPVDGDDRTEFIEFVNISQGVTATTLDLSGVRLSDGPSEPFVFSEGTTLAAEQRVIIARDAAAFRAAYPSVPDEVLAGQFQGRLANDGEDLKLEDANGATVLEFNYGDGPRWPAAADGAGASLQLINLRETATEEYGEPSKWRSSTLAGGTPGSESVAPLGVVINEVLARSPVGQYDAIELHNMTQQSLDVSGWFLSDSAGQLLKFRIPVGTVIAPQGYVVFDERDFNPTPAHPTPEHFALSGDGDDVWLVVSDQTGNLAQFVDHVEFGASLETSFGRRADGGGELVPQSRVTLGSSNRFAQIGPLVISEIQYNPVPPSQTALAIDPQLTSSRLEFVEVHNPTRTVEALTGWTLAGGIEYTFDEGIQLKAGESILIVPFNPTAPDNADRLVAFRAHYGLDASVQIVGGYQGNLSNGGDWVRLLRPRGGQPLDTTLVFVDQAHFDDRLPWSEMPDGQGDSLARRSPVSAGDRAASWRAAEPTPGTVGFDLLHGDLSGEGSIDAHDIDLLFDAIHNQSTLPWYDLNDDEAVDRRDVNFLVNDILQTTAGDANLDGVFNSRDLVRVFQAGGYEDGLIANSTWSKGDWNGDGNFTTADLVGAFQAGVYELAAAIPSAEIAAALDAIFVERNPRARPRACLA